MNNTILISILNISNQPSPTSINENPDINDPEIVEEVLKYIGKAGYRKITDILLFILSDLINRRVINPDIQLLIYEYLVMGGTMIEPISNELNDLVLNGLRDSNGTIWAINPYFSSDWKFMAIVCVIEKTMDQIKLKPPPGHIKSPLLQMIPLSHYVPDELHIMLRIWDRLWDLVLQELKTQNQFNDLARAKILAKMRRISISFNFWQEQGMQNWSYISLMGGDKE
ncbi:hypothetical protein C1646_749935 [Rhizophagus diaphanus]|nr:hypothetical protein C1646_749935 [Rhizophagus diaphanus] [Rhizophagus sp. MUCL 43196]